MQAFLHAISPRIQLLLLVGSDMRRYLAPSQPFVMVQRPESLWTDDRSPAEQLRAMQFCLAPAADAEVSSSLIYRLFNEGSDISAYVPAEAMQLLRHAWRRA